MENLRGSRSSRPASFCVNIWLTSPPATTRRRLRRLPRAAAESKRRADHLVQTYGFMLDHDDAVPEHWSHYDEYFKSREISKARVVHADLDDRFVETVPTIPAEDVRKKLAKSARRSASLRSSCPAPWICKGRTNFTKSQAPAPTPTRSSANFGPGWPTTMSARNDPIRRPGAPAALEVKKLELLLSGSTAA